MLHAEMIQKVEQSVTENKVINKNLDKVEVQTKQFIGERQGAWELHYSNQEIQLRKKADKNKELLQKHQSQSQVCFPVMSVFEQHEITSGKV